RRARRAHRPPAALGHRAARGRAADHRRLREGLRVSAGRPAAGRGTKRRPRIELEIADRFRPRTPRELLERVVTATLDHAGRRDLAVSLLLTDDAGIAALHGRFLGDPRETDVMSFDTDGTADVVVNVARARREAQRRGTTIRSEIALYVVH